MLFSIVFKSSRVCALSGPKFSFLFEEVNPWISFANASSKFSLALRFFFKKDREFATASKTLSLFSK